jgi:dihydrofolate synthase/folylpolyglutamate synthase
MVYLPHWPIPSTFGGAQIDYETVFERCTMVLEALGNPHLKLPPIIHIAGTNGKGSSAALMAEIFAQANYQAHLYTSPHLHDCNERIVLNGEKISDSFLFEVIEETRLAAEKTNATLTFMEGFTLAAFVAFSKVKADVLILECGMGGRIDITNIFAEKLLTLITPVSFDHMEYLGENIERIALEKAMIMRPNTPLIVSAQCAEAKNIIKILAKDQEISAFYYDEDFEVEVDEESGNFDFKFAQKIIENLPKPALEGMHQYVNFASVLAAISVLAEKFSINESAIRKAISQVFWPSRMQKINNFLNKILENSESEIILDGAHNPSGAMAVANFFKENLDEKLNFVICGFSRGKCKKDFLMQFENVAQILAVRVNGEPYPEDSEVIAQIGSEIGFKIPAFQNLEDAVFYIKNLVKNKVCRIVICGSLHLARDVKKFD